MDSIDGTDVVGTEEQGRWDEEKRWHRHRGSKGAQRKQRQETGEPDRWARETRLSVDHHTSSRGSRSSILFFASRDKLTSAMKRGGEEGPINISSHEAIPKQLAEP